MPEKNPKYCVEGLTLERPREVLRRCTVALTLSFLNCGTGTTGSGTCGRESGTFHVYF